MRTLAFTVVLFAAPLAHAEAAGANPISQTMAQGYERVKKFIVAAADKMPAGEYDYKPTPDVRSYGQLIAHLADAQYMFCSAAKGEKSPMKTSVEKSTTGKDKLTKALADAFAYCDPVYSGATDATLTQPADLFGGKRTKFAALDINVGHDNEHYGNIVTYLRLKKIVPPSTAGEK